jgi:hypothetical protein
MDFSSVPVRAPGITDVSWWNSLRTAGLWLQGFFGSTSAGLIGETTFSFANGQGSAASVTGLLFDKTLVKAAKVWISGRRKTDSLEAYALIELHLIYRELTATWDLTQRDEGDDTGLLFSVTSGGQVQYTSTTIAGTNYAGASRFKALAFGL